MSVAFERDEEFAEQIGEMLPLSRREHAEQPCFVRYVCPNRCINEGVSFGRQGDKDATPIVRVRGSRDQASTLQPVDPVCHGARGKHERIEELARRKAVRRAGTAEGRKDIKLARLETNRCEGRLQRALQMTCDTRDAANNTYWGRIEIGPFAHPLVQNVIYMVSIHRSILA